MALTKVSPSLFQVSNNITSVTVGGSANTISLTFDSNGVITGASNNAVSVANTAITGNIISSQIASVSGSVITANTIANSAIQTGAVENYMNAAGLGFGMRNRIINGAMVIDQRNAGASYSAVDSTYGLDRWKLASWDGSSQVTGKYTVIQSSTAPTGFPTSMLITSSAATTIGAGAIYWVGQMIEGFNTADLGFGAAGASTVTVSFWVRSSLTGTFGGAIANSAHNRSYPFSYTINSANTFEYKTVTITGDTSGTWLTTNGIGIRIFFNLGSGTTYQGTANAWSGSQLTSVTGTTSLLATNAATLYIAGVQLEKGSTATSFDYRPYTTELQLCQRYYQLAGMGGSYLNSTSSQQGRFMGTPCVTPRASPTFTLVSSNIVGNVAAANPTSYNSGATTHLQVQSSAGSGSYTDANYTYSLSAEL